MTHAYRSTAISSDKSSDKSPSPCLARATTSVGQQPEHPEQCEHARPNERLKYPSSDPYSCPYNRHQLSLLTHAIHPSPRSAAATVFRVAVCHKNEIIVQLFNGKELYLYLHPLLLRLLCRSTASCKSVQDRLLLRRNWAGRHGVICRSTRRFRQVYQTTSLNKGNEEEQTQRQADA